MLAFSDKYLYELPEGHRFPISKYELVKQQLLHEGTISESNLYDPGLVEEEIILQTHTKEYWDKLKKLTLSTTEIRRVGLPVNEKSVNRARNSVAGTITSSLIALKEGVGMNLAGGTHHAYADHGEGFCILNDIAIASNYLLLNDKVRKILVCDLDVHQGNGTAHIFQNDDRVFTFSVHGEGNYPLHKEISDLDIALSPDISDDRYLEIVCSNLTRLIEEKSPDIIFYQAGVDILDTDKLGKLNISKVGCLERDKTVMNSCLSNKIPLVVTMGGGYNKSLSELIEAHANTFREAIKRYHL